MLTIAKALAAVMALTLTANAAPTPETENMNELDARDNGDFTWYHTGLGACGWTNHNGELVAAVGHALYDRTRPCGRRIRAHHRGKSIVVTVVDRCEGCKDNDVDFTPEGFKRLVGSLGPGRVRGTWEFI
ncbi:expansin module family protein [Pochonia chlamydosporia 170]|uniref:Expansin module family protein n=1 Tax=Pochonia chlamydosporia 170 TaxID=1380566 RepID=A0A179F529_METCM|nr:expansin module family protein [Pochonia chlamydosporia 170]OAQ60534.1 expansin module family protein [Pochonia chlamydosporia 170]